MRGRTQARVFRAPPLASPRSVAPSDYCAFKSMVAVAVGDTVTRTVRVTGGPSFDVATTS